MASAGETEMMRHQVGIICQISVDIIEDRGRCGRVRVVVVGEWGETHSKGARWRVAGTAAATAATGAEAGKDE